MVNFEVLKKKGPTKVVNGLWENIVENASPHQMILYELTS
jgi:hypothetical protein